ncbi:MAG: GGDEF domain-containing protein [Erysipelotrichaceae bacterium]|nr:GGDEF domain-containing protein [Erysipelotrichaceae bacterium]
MSNGINTMAVFIANGLALVLISQYLFSYGFRFTKDRNEDKIIRYMLLICAVACLADPLASIFDSRPGKLSYLIVYLANLYLYVSNMLIGSCWIIVLNKHLIGSLPRHQKIVMGSLSLLGILALVVNFFTPVVFTVDSFNTYHRESLFWLYTVIECIFMVDSIFVYIQTKIKGGIFKFFPVLRFVFPVVLGVLVQSFFYGVSTIWPAITISLSGFLNGLRNESLYRDSLTNLFNRLYLTDVGEELKRKKKSITVCMIDLNYFKEINDKYGHGEGDRALISTAQLMVNSVGALGNVVRYAGDEFVILLNTVRRDHVEEFIETLQHNFDEYNRFSTKEYKLSLSIGVCIQNDEFANLDAMITEADRLMYIEKAKLGHKR